MSSSSKRKGIKKLIFTNNLGCGCGKTKLSDIIEPKTKTKTKTYPILFHSSSSRRSWERRGSSSIATTLSLNNIDTSPAHCSEHANDSTTSSKMTNRPPWKLISDSIAVVKDSDDPYHDFRKSMLQMILEKKIYSKDDLQELLHCFLNLNSQSHHEIIVQAFMDIWNGVISSSTETASVT